MDVCGKRVIVAFFRLLPVCPAATTYLCTLLKVDKTRITILICCIDPCFTKQTAKINGDEAERNGYLISLVTIMLATTATL